jgi:hypothetical protein
VPLDFAALDTRIATIVGKAQPFQDARTTARTRYVQVRDTDLDWAAVSVTRLDRGVLSAEVHEYDGPRGKGWIAYFEAADGADLWRRGVHQGPEVERWADPVVDRQGVITWSDRGWQRTTEAGTP